MEKSNSYLIHIDSNFRKSNEQIYNFSIDVPPNKDGFKKAKCAVYSIDGFPAGSISQINPNNNVLRFIEVTTTYTLTIPEGNYSISELIVVLKNLMESASVSTNTYTITYSEITNRISFTRATGTDTATLVLSGSTIANLIGLTQNTSIISTATELLNEVDLTPIKYCYLICRNILSSNFASIIGGNNILFKIPISANRNEMIYYINNDIAYDVVDLPILPLKFEFQLIDAYGNYINTNGINFAFTLRIYPS